MKKYILIFYLSFLFSITYGQISQGGFPLSFQKPMDLDEIDTKILKEINSDKINKYEKNNKKGKLLIGINIPTNFNTENSGTWSFLENGDKIWRLKIISKNAKAISLYYDDFYLPDGSKLFLYNEEKTSLIGAFTISNNKDEKRFATIETIGEVTILEYFEPVNTNKKARISISEVCHQYKFLKSGDCQVNINCSEGNEWQEQKRSVLKIIYPNGEGTYLATGVLVNNEKQNYIPYFLTAAHNFILDNGNFMGHEYYSQIKFYFNYEAKNCYGSFSSENQTTVGAALRAYSEEDNGGDFGSDLMLIELTCGLIPQNYNPYFSAWETRDNLQNEFAVCIHHPSGDIKKISRAENIISESFLNGDNTHWKVDWVETINGFGRTEGGSSGSPLFNQDKRIIGTLTGGPAYCDGPINDYFGKFSYDWELNGEETHEKLKTFLDPDNTGIQFIDGINYWEGDYVKNIYIDEIKIFPNPARDNIQIDIKKYKNENNLQISIYSVCGNIIKNYNIIDNKKKIKINLKNFKKGFYFVVLKNDKKVFAKNKLIIY